MDDEREERSSMTDEERQRLIELAGCERTHDPIIVDGGSSFNLTFDGPGTIVYKRTNADKPTRFSGDDLIIAKVSVIVGGRVHSCPGVPANGRCTILIQGERGGKHKAVKVTGKAGASGDVVEIELDKGEYPEQITGGDRKGFGRHDSKVKSLTIIDDDTGDMHKCTGIPTNGKCQVVICDDHEHRERRRKGSADAE